MYRIMTEDTNRRGIQQILSQHFTAFTVFPALGCWKGKQERSLVIELSGVKRRDVIRAAQEIKERNKQDAVLVQRVAESAALV